MTYAQQLAALAVNTTGTVDDFILDSMRGGEYAAQAGASFCASVTKKDGAAYRVESRESVTTALAVGVLAALKARGSDPATLADLAKQWDSGSASTDAAEHRKVRREASRALTAAYPECASSAKSYFGTYATAMDYCAEHGITLTAEVNRRGTPRYLSPSEWAQAAAAHRRAADESAMTPAAKLAKTAEERLADVQAAVRRALGAGIDAASIRNAVTAAIS